MENVRSIVKDKVWMTRLMNKVDCLGSEFRLIKYVFGLAFAMQISRPESSWTWKF